MSPNDLIAHFGSVSATAKAFGIKAPSVSEWIANGQVPVPRQFQGEVLTQGALKADRSRSSATA